LKYTIFIFLATLIGCSKPIADFTLISDSTSAPTKVKFKNTSVGAETYQWKINGKPLSDSVDINHQFLSSGRYTVDLTAAKGQKKSHVSKEFIVDAPIDCLVYMETSLGPLLLSLSELTPIHRDNFLKLVELSYYNDIAFHRVIDGFMIQAGDDRTRKVKKRIQHEEEIEEEISFELMHHKGALAAARMPDDINPERASSGTQFYIVDGRDVTIEELERVEAGKLFDYTEEQKEEYISKGGAPQLDGEYTVFGILIDGFDTLEKIVKAKTDNRDNPEEAVRILNVMSIN